MNSFLDIWRGLDWSVLTDMALRVVPALLCITIHELCHGFVAYLFGDQTAKRAGRLSLNPLRHIDIMGLLMMLVFRFGWAKPVPVDASQLRRPKQNMAVIALAGPVSNLLLAALTLLLYGFLFTPLVAPGFGSVVLDMLYTMAYLSIALAVFNIIPIPPLDGSKVLFSFLSDRVYGKLLHYERYGMIILLVLVAAKVISGPLSIATGWVFDRIWILAEWGFSIGTRLF